MITELKPNQVFVFGSNARGFHGAGAAGYAFKGSAANDWRINPMFQRAMRDPEYRGGKWAVLYRGQGFQIGTEGMSYAIETIKKPGQRRSTTRRSIYRQLMQLFRFAREHPELEFLMTPIGCGYSGYTPCEMEVVWDYTVKQHGLPDNVVAPNYNNVSVEKT